LAFGLDESNDLFGVDTGSFSTAMIGIRFVTLNYRRLS
jgi:hypothetical protein